MRNIWTIARREYNQYFNSPVAYGLAAVVLFVVGLIFVANMQLAGSQGGFVPDMGLVYSPMAFILVMTLPGITMRVLADEQRLGTLELLLTAPVRDWEIVVGKWLGAYLFVLSVIAMTFVYPIVLNRLVEPGIDQGTLITGYLGLALAMGALVSLGVFISSLFSNLIAGFLWTLGVNIVVWFLMGIPAQIFGTSRFFELLDYLDFSSHYQSLIQGAIDLSGIVYYLSIMVLALFLGSISLESRRWR